MAFASGTAAAADDYTGKPPPTVGGVDLGNPLRDVGTSRTRAAGSARGLAVTGSDVLPLTAIGLSALGTGAALVLHGRKRRAV